MQRLKEIFKKLFCLPPLPTVLIAVPSFIFVFVMLSMGEHSILSHVAYGLSAYAMVITATGCTKIIRAARQGVESLPVVRKIRSNPVGERLWQDDIFRSEISLHGGLAVNLLYVGLNLFSGVRYQSAWFVTLAFYYASLSAMRTLLVAQVHRTAVGQDIPADFRRFRLYLKGLYSKSSFTRNVLFA